MWVFFHKFDEQGGLFKFTTWLITKSYLKNTDFAIFAATLAARLFKFLITLITVFGFNNKQYNAVNAFTYNIINKPIFCKISFGWMNNPNILLKLSKKNYGLKQSLILWRNEFVTIVINLKFESILEIKCIYLNAYIIVVFL